MYFFVLKSFRETGDELKRKSQEDQGKQIHIRVPNQILMIIKNERFLGSTKMRAPFSDTLGIQVCSKTIKDRLLEGKLYGSRPAKKPSLSEKNRRYITNFSKTHVH